MIRRTGFKELFIISILTAAIIVTLGCFPGYTTEKPEITDTVQVQLFESCVVDVGCTSLPEGLEAYVHDYWLDYGIEVQFLPTLGVNVPAEYKVLLPSKEAIAMDYFMVGSTVRYNTLPATTEITTIAWFNTVLEQEGRDQQENPILGWGFDDMRLFITNAWVEDFYTLEEFVSLVNHEIGHVFSLEHVNDTDNLMSEGLSASTDDQLTERQVKKAKEYIREHTNCNPWRVDNTCKED